ncbi:MAG: hypothetical protein QOC92_341 [Acidimicrobiaceae bacterium]
MEVLRTAKAEADDVRAQANRYAAERVRESDATRDHARREVVKAQEQALAIRSEAQRTADSVVRNATTKARSEADELLREAQRQLARAVGEARDAEARAAAARESEAEALERMVSVAGAAAGEVDVSDRWVVDLTGEGLDEMVAGAVNAAVRRAVHPVVIRAGRYTIVRTPQRQ